MDPGPWPPPWAQLFSWALGFPQLSLPAGALTSRPASRLPRAPAYAGQDAPSRGSVSASWASGPASPTCPAGVQLADLTWPARPFTGAPGKSEPGYLDRCWAPSSLCPVSRGPTALAPTALWPRPRQGLPAPERRTPSQPQATLSLLQTSWVPSLSPVPSWNRTPPWASLIWSGASQRRFSRLSWPTLHSPSAPGCALSSAHILLCFRVQSSDRSPQPSLCGGPPYSLVPANEFGSSEILLPLGS